MDRIFASWGTDKAIRIPFPGEISKARENASADTTSIGQRKCGSYSPVRIVRMNFGEMS